jgi:hypothetical protein
VKVSTDTARLRPSITMSCENSPAIYGWEKRSFNFASPVGTAERFFRPCGTPICFGAINPELKLWAIFADDAAPDGAWEFFRVGSTKMPPQRG